MAISPSLSDPSVAQRFFQPVRDLIPSCLYSRPCPSLSDALWVERHVGRILFPATSGRGFLQEHAGVFGSRPDLGHFFESIKSRRRLSFVAELNSRLRASLRRLVPDRFASFPELADFDLYAGDGHWHGAAVHDPIHDGTKYATGHFFGIDLRCGGVFHLTIADFVQRRKEHDMHALKRLELGHLRQGAPTGRKVLWVWDKAGIDFAQWYRWKCSAGIYFVSRAKENMIRHVMGINDWNRNDPINRHVEDDVLVGTSQGVSVRWIRYRDPVDGELIELITSEMNLPPGLIAHLYRVRWDIEKVFDEFKNKFIEKKSWGSSSVAKAVHGQFLCLAHTLLSLFEKTVVEPNGITNVAEDARRQRRVDATESQLQKAGAEFPEALRTFSRSTQHSVKFIRWLRSSLVSTTSWEAAQTELRALYATL